MTPRAQQFVDAWRRHGGDARAVAEELGLNKRSGVHNRRLAIERKYGISLSSNSVHSSRNAAIKRRNARRLDLTLDEGVIVIFSDAHYWPGLITTAHRGLVKLLPRLKPTIIVNGGDAFDGARISRHDRIGWDERPTVKQELEACQDRLTEVEKAYSAILVWLYGNHCLRFDTRLAALNPDYIGVRGMALKDHFPEWQFATALFVNDNLVIKHRYHNGLHATHNNAVKSGRSMATGHLHSLKVTPWTDYNGTRYGVDTGTLAESDGDQFDYTEDNPKNWRSGFAVLTYKDGRLLYPEVVQVWDEQHVEFRGEVIPV